VDNVTLVLMLLNSLLQRAAQVSNRIQAGAIDDAAMQELIAADDQARQEQLAALERARAEGR
jgi:hypothetical protein